MILWAIWNGEDWPKSFLGSQFMIPWINFTAAAIVVLVMEEGSWLNRVCSQGWVCWFGRRSYGLYIIHLIYARVFWNRLPGYLSQHIPHVLAIVVSAAIAFSLTVLLAILCYELIEKRFQRLKQHLAYGPVKDIPTSTVLVEKHPVETEA